MGRLKLTVDASENAINAGYDCPCGCHPAIAYERGGAVATEGCCCGNQFAVGHAASAVLAPMDGFTIEVEQFQTPWGEGLEAAWAIGPSKH